jgi:hypothetical protein
MQVSLKELENHRGSFDSNFWTVQDVLWVLWHIPCTLALRCLNYVNEGRIQNICVFFLLFNCHHDIRTSSSSNDDTLDATNRTTNYELTLTLRNRTYRHLLLQCDGRLEKYCLLHIASCVLRISPVWEPPSGSHSSVATYSSLTASYSVCFGKLLGSISRGRSLRSPLHTLAHPQAVFFFPSWRTKFYCAQRSM